MLIDWFTVLAQIVNFLVLVVLLKRFLYRPILNAMQRREDRIAARLREAADKRAEAEEAAEAYRAKARELDEERDRLMEQARLEAEALRKKMVQEARHEVSELRERWQAAVHDEQDAFLKELTVRTGSHVYGIARQALTDLAGADLERAMVDRFLQRLSGSEENGRRIAGSIGEPAQGVTVRSAFEIPEEDRRRISPAVQDLMGAAVEIRYETCPDLLCGIELAASGHAVGWNLGGYLQRLEEEVRTVLEGLPVGQRRESERR